ncbi:MAG: autotransporter-associated beta strand repeat-containing protein [Phycisphaeraceae bacterium]
MNRIALIAVFPLLFAGAVTAQTTYTYTEMTSTTTQWSEGTGWDLVPQSASDTILTFTSALDEEDPPAPIPLDAGTEIISNNDISGNFLLNRLNFTYTGAPTAETPMPTVTISGNPLEFTGTNATFNFSPPGGSGQGNLGLTVSNNLVLSSDLTISTGTNHAGPDRIVRLDGAISGVGDLTFNWGAGGRAVFELSNPDNSYAGDTRLVHGSTTGRPYILRLGASDVISNGAGGGNLVFSTGNEASGAIFELRGFNETINGLASNLPAHNSSATSTIVRNALANSTSTLTLGDNDASATYYGAIQDGAANAVLNLTKIGSGTQVLASGGVTYTGTTTITQGTLEIDYSQRSHTQTTNPVNHFSADSDIILDGGATFAIEGRRDGEAVSSEAISGGAGLRAFTLANSVADRLTVGQGVTLETTTDDHETWIVALNRGDTTTTVSVNRRLPANLQSISTVDEAATTSQTLKSLTLSGAADSSHYLDFGSSANLALTINSGPVQDNAGSKLMILNWAGNPVVGGGGDQFRFAGSPTDFSSVFAQGDVIFDGFGAGYELVENGSFYEVTAIPEPGAIGLFAAGGLLLALRRRRA